MTDNNTAKGQLLLAEAMDYYSALGAFRRDRCRNKRYNYGDQWSDTIDVNGRKMTEERYIMEQGNIPLKNNLIRRLVRNVVGVYNMRAASPRCVSRHAAAAKAMGELLSRNAAANRLTSLYMRSMEEFLISGMVVHRKSCGVRGGRLDCWTDFVQPDNFFVDTRMRDFRGWDCTCAGEIHDVTFDEVCRAFATDEESCSRLAGYFGEADNNMAPRTRKAETLCRVTELWRKENVRTLLCHDQSTGKVYRTKASRQREIEKENDRRKAARIPPINTHWQIREVWRYYFIAPDGHILREGDSPYRHGRHPYVFKIYPMIDGEVHSFVGDVVDQQRYTNRLITLYDWIMRASSKGVLLVPEECVPKGISQTQFADTWSRYDGVLFYNPSVNGVGPQQVATNSTNIGIRELLDVQLKFFEDISGVNEALQGRTKNVAMSAELFGKQTQHATATLLDILDTFSEFVRDAAYIDISNIQQFTAPEEIADIDFEVEMDRPQTAL